MGMEENFVRNVIASDRRWNRDMAIRLNKKTGGDFTLVDRHEDLTVDNLKQINPDYIFFPHWSRIIPPEIFDNFTCVIFHMTDLPYGRGGSPLQNLIVNGHKDTVVTALKCVKQLDAGPVYLKRQLSLFGSAEEIYLRAGLLIEDMICTIIQERPEPSEQTGTPVEFKRRTPGQGDWSKAEDLDKVFDHIRMLDADGYPHAFVRIGRFKLEFTRASRRTDSVISDVRITIEKTDE